MPSKLEHEFVKLRGETKETGQVYTDTIADLQTTITNLNTQVSSLESNKKNDDSRLKRIEARARNILSKALKGIADAKIALDAANASLQVRSGEYDGNDASNRAIAHGLGSKPQIVFMDDGGAGEFILQYDTKIISFRTSDNSISAITVTAKNTTNFYVSGAANCGGGSVRWVAIG